MRKETFLALLDTFLEEKIEQVKNELAPIKGERGLRGLKGSPGQAFDFEDHKEEIFSEIKSHLVVFQEQYKLKFSDLTEEEVSTLQVKPEDVQTQVEQYVSGLISQLKLNFSDLTEEEKQSLTVVGPRGQRGKPGIGFSLEDNREAVNKILLTIFEEKKADLKIKFSDLIDSDKEDLKLNFEDLTDENKGELKLKFADLTEEDKETLKIRGPRGQRGKTIKGEDGATWHTGTGKPTMPANFDDLYFDGITGAIYKYSEEWELFSHIMGPRGPRGAAGLTGLTGVGIDGRDGVDGLDAPKIIDIELKRIGKNKIYFLFTFDNGTKIETDRVNLPEAVSAMAILNNGGGGGRDPYLNRDFVAQTNNYTNNKVTSIDYYNNAAKAATDRRGRTELTFTGNKVTQEDFYLYGGDGTTETRHIRYTYTYTGNRLAGSLAVDL